MTILRDPKSGPATDARVGEELATTAQPGSFIVTLRALPGPLAVPQPRAPELQRFRFFVSRRVADGCELFYLSMGFFPTLEECEKWLNIFRKTYPKAFVSKLAGTPSISMPAAPSLSDTQILRVLESRAPKRDAEHGETRTGTGSYAVQSEERVLATGAQSPTLVRPTLLPTPQLKPANPVSAAPRVSGQGSAQRLADALQALTASNLDADISDSSSTTGVRHLRVEIQRKSKRPLKPSSVRKS